MSDIKITSLHDFHKSKNAKMIDFAGWSMPFSYDGTLKEHNYVNQPQMIVEFLRYIGVKKWISVVRPLFFGIFQHSDVGTVFNRF